MAFGQICSAVTGVFLPSLLVWPAREVVSADDSVVGTAICTGRSACLDLYTFEKSPYMRNKAAIPFIVEVGNGLASVNRRACV